jgi:RHS repeat-associated protein
LTAVVNWGDGTQDQGLIGAGGGGYQVEDSHTFAHPGQYTAWVLVRNADIGWAVATTAIDIAAAAPPAGPVVVTSWRQHGTVGSALSGVIATFTDNSTGHAGCDTATILWGDGSQDTAQVVAAPGQPGVYEVLGSHTYSAAGAYEVTTHVTTQSGPDGFGYATAVVDDLPFTAAAAAPLSVGPVTQPFSPDAQGSLFTVLATVSTANALVAGGIGAGIDWGGDIASGVFSTAAVWQSGSTDFVVAEVPYYKPGTYLARVVIGDSSGQTTSVNTTVTVGDYTAWALPWVDAGIARDPNAGEPLVHASISWGDGTPPSTLFDGDAIPGSSGGAGDAYGETVDFARSHVFPKERTYTVHATSLFDKEDDHVGITTKVTTVGDAAVTVCSGDLPTLRAGQTLTGPALAVFSDDDPTASAGDYQVLIWWGDGSSSSGAVTQLPDGTFAVSGGHTYSAPGQYEPIITIQDSGGASTVADSLVTVVADVQSLTGIPVAAARGLPTGPVTVATFTEPDGLGQQEQATINWGDGGQSAGTIVSLGGGVYAVQGDYTYSSAGVMAVSVVLTDASGTTHEADSYANVFTWQAQATQLTNDPQVGMLLPVGQGQVAVNTGDLHLGQALDFDQSPGTDVGRNPALVYNSGTVGSAPIVQLTLSGSAVEAMPDEILVALAIDGGDYGPVQTYQTTGHEPGSAYLLAVQAGADAAGLATGVHGWQARVQFVYGTGSTAITATAVMTGTVQVVNNSMSPIGAGWSIAGIDHLVPTCTGVLWVTGTGDARLYQRQDDGTFTAPQDFGTLVRNDDGTWTYTAKDQTREQFNSDGWLTSVIDTHGLTTSYHYGPNDELTEVDSIDGGVTTLAYAGGLLQTITEPGGRVWTLQHNGSDLTGVTDPTGATRTLDYAQHLLTHDSWQPLDTGFGYTGGRLTSIDQGGGSVWTVSAAAVQGLNGPTAAFPSDAVAQVVSPLGYADSYTMTADGATLTHTRPDLRSETWTRDDHEQVTQYSDFLQQATAYHYDYSASGKGDLVEVDYPDGGVVSTVYDPTFHQPTEITDQDGVVTDNTYDPSTGDLLTTTVAPGTADEATTTYVWQAGLLQSTTDPAGDVVDYQYTGRLLIGEEHYGSDGLLASEMSYHHDAAGNVDRQTDGTSSDGEGFVTSFTTDGVNQLTSTTDGDGHTSTQHYTASGLVDRSSDGRGIVTTNLFDTRGLVNSSTVDAGGNNPETTTYGNDLDGRQVLVLSAIQEPTRSYFDINGQQVEQTDPMGYTSDTLFDDNGDVRETVDNNGNQTKDQRDSMGRVTDEQVLAPDGQTLVKHEQWTYDLAGLTLTETNGDNNVTGFGYNAAGIQVSTQENDSSGAAVSSDADKVNGAGEVKTETDGDGNTTTRTYNGDGQVKTEVVTDKNNNVVRSLSYTYYDDGRQHTEVDGDGNTTTWTYHPDGNVWTEVTTASDGSVVNSVTYNLYDGNGNVLSETDGDGNTTLRTYTDEDQVQTEVVTDKDGNVVRSTTFGYDGDNRETTEVDGEGNTTVRKYDGDDNVQWEKVYDKYNNLVRNVTYNKYDGNGNVLSETDGDGNTTLRTFNADDQVLTEQVYDKQNNLVRSTSNVLDLDGNTTTTTDGDGNQTTQTWNGDRLVHEVVKDHNGTVVRDTTYTPDEDGNVTRTVDGDGNTTTSTYLGDQLVHEVVTDKNGAVVRDTTYKFDADGNTQTTIDGDGNTTTSTYLGDRLVHEVVKDKNGAVVSDTTYTPDPDGNITTTVDGEGNTTTSTYLGDQLVHETVTDKNNNVVRDTSYQYNEDGQVKSETDGDGNTTTSTYLGGQLVHEVVTDKNNKVVRDTTYQYDLDGNVQTTIDGDGNTTTSTYLGDQLVHEVVTDKNNNVVRDTTYQYNEDGQVKSESDGDGNTTTSTYLGGQLVEEVVTDKNNTVVRDTSWVYDLDGNVQTMTDGDGNVTTSTYLGDQLVHETVTDKYNEVISDTSYLYNEDGQVKTSTDGDGNVTTSTYLGGQLVEEVVKDPSGKVINDTSWVYDTNGNVQTTTDGDGNVTTSTYLGDQLVHETVTDKDGTVVRDTAYTYDEDGNVKTSTDADGNTTTNTYLGGQLVQAVVTDNNGQVISTTSYQHDTDGNVTVTTDGDGNTTTDTYLGDQLVKRVIADQNGVVASSVSWTYDELGYVASETDGDGNVTSYVRDIDGNVLSMTTPLGTWTYKYDKAGNRILQSDPLGRSISWVWDGNELASATWYNADGSVANVLGYGYDTDGNLTSASNNAGSYSFKYDGNELIQEVTPGGVTLNFLHDEEGNASTVSDSLGATVTGKYNGDGSLKTTSYSDQQGNQARQDFSPDHAGLVKTQTRYADTAATQVVGTTSIGYHGPDLVASLLHQDGVGNVLGNYSYVYDTAGWLNSRTEDGVSTGFGYDGAGQLKQAGNQGYSYDGNGNPTSGGTVVGADNELVSAGGWFYRYDAVGNLISRYNPSSNIRWTYSYDTINELSSATQSDLRGGTVLVQVSYSYDVFGNRITTSVTQNGMTTTTQSVYEAVGNPQVGGELTQWRLWSEQSSQGGGVTHYLAGDQPDQWLARVGPGLAVHWYLSDQQGSVRVVTGANGAVLDRIGYDAWGNITTETVPGAGGRVGFQGGLLDRATGMIQFGARDYSPQMRRWLEQDPSGLGPDSNPYRAMGNAPTNGTDPSGLATVLPAREQQILKDALRPEDRQALANEYVSAVQKSRLGVMLGSSPQVDSYIADILAGRVQSKEMTRIIGKYRSVIDATKELSPQLDQSVQPLVSSLNSSGKLGFSLADQTELDRMVLNGRYVRAEADKAATASNADRMYERALSRAQLIHQDGVVTSWGWWAASWAVWGVSWVVPLGVEDSDFEAGKSVEDTARKIVALQQAGEYHPLLNGSDRQLQMQALGQRLITQAPQILLALVGMGGAGRAASRAVVSTVGERQLVASMKKAAQEALKQGDKKLARAFTEASKVLERDGFQAAEKYPSGGSRT